MRYILLNHLFKTNTSQSTNKFFYGQGGRKKILKVIDYFIESNNIAYIDGIKEKKEENDNLVGKN